MKTCPLFKATNILGKKWTFILLQEIASHQGTGFNTMFKRLKKISPKIMAQRLKQLESEELITKHVQNIQLQRRTTYSLTEKGKELNHIIQDLKGWAEKYEETVKCRNTECVTCSRY